MDFNQKVNNNRFSSIVSTQKNTYAANLKPFTQNFTPTHYIIQQLPSWEWPRVSDCNNRSRGTTKTYGQLFTRSSTEDPPPVVVIAKQHLKTNRGRSCAELLDKMPPISQDDTKNKKHVKRKSVCLEDTLSMHSSFDLLSKDAETQTDDKISSLSDDIKAQIDAVTQTSFKSSDQTVQKEEFGIKLQTDKKTPKIPMIQLASKQIGDRVVFCFIGAFLDFFGMTRDEIFSIQNILISTNYEICQHAAAARKA